MQNNRPHCPKYFRKLPRKHLRGRRGWGLFVVKWQDKWTSPLSFSWKKICKISASGCFCTTQMGENYGIWHHQKLLQKLFKIQHDVTCFISILKCIVLKNRFMFIANMLCNYVTEIIYKLLFSQKLQWQANQSNTYHPLIPFVSILSSCSVLKSIEGGIGKK